jgi:hypothetical protein
MPKNGPEMPEKQGFSGFFIARITTPLTGIEWTGLATFGHGCAAKNGYKLSG